jgi:hypothetical protein
MEACAGTREDVTDEGVHDVEEELRVCTSNADIGEKIW